MSTQSGLMNHVPDMKQLPALRQPLDVYLIHHHEPVGQTVMAKRLGDYGELGPRHKITWNYYKPRQRWEAVCEHTDVVFYATATPADALFRMDRTLV